MCFVNSFSDVPIVIYVRITTDKKATTHTTNNLSIPVSINFETPKVNNNTVIDIINMG